MLELVHMEREFESQYEELNYLEESGSFSEEKIEHVQEAGESV